MPVLNPYEGKASLSVDKGTDFHSRRYLHNYNAQLIKCGFCMHAQISQILAERKWVIPQTSKETTL